MSTTYAYPISVNGLLTPWIGNDGDFKVAHSASGGTLTRLFLTVSDAPSGGPLTAQIRTAVAGGGVGLGATIADGTNSGTATGNLTIPAASDLYLRITAANGSPLNLSGYFQLTEATSPVVTADLTTLARVKQHANITDASQDTFLDTLISGVSVAMVSYMGRAILSVAHTDEKRNGSGRLAGLTLNHGPIISVEKVTENDTVLTASQYEFDADPDPGILIRLDANGDPTAWKGGYRNVKVDYTAGYATVPEDLVLAATKQVRHEFHQSAPSLRDQLSQTSKALETGGETTYVPDGLLPSVRQAADRYKRVVAI